MPPSVWIAMATTALFSVLIFWISELVSTQTSSLQHRLSTLTAARTNALLVQRDLQQALAARWAYISNHQARHLNEGNEASHLASMRLSIVQGLLQGEAMLTQAVKLESSVQDQISGRSDLLPGIVQGQMDAFDRGLRTAAAQTEEDIANNLSRQRMGTAFLVSLNLLFLSALAARAVRHFYDQERQKQTLSAQTQELEAAVLGRTRELHELSTYLQRQSEEEKAALARELHDELGALLTAAKIDVAWLQGRNPGEDALRTTHLKQLSMTLDQAFDIKARVIDNLYPSLLKFMGLGPALVWYVQQTCDRAELVHQVDVTEDDLLVDAETALALYRITQEALNNTIRHAHANEVWVSLFQTLDKCILRVHDDGRGILGFSPDRLSHGMAGMRHRVAAIGGVFNVRSTPGKGTSIEVLVPLQRTACSPISPETEAADGGASCSVGYEMSPLINA